MKRVAIIVVAMGLLFAMAAPSLAHDIGRRVIIIMDIRARTTTAAIVPWWSFPRWLPPPRPTATRTMRPSLRPSIRRLCRVRSTTIASPA